MVVPFPVKLYTENLHNWLLQLQCLDDLVFRAIFIHLLVGPAIIYFPKHFRTKRFFFGPQIKTHKDSAEKFLFGCAFQDCTVSMASSDESASEAMRSSLHRRSWAMAWPWHSLFAVELSTARIPSACLFLHIQREEDTKIIKYYNISNISINIYIYIIYTLCHTCKNENMIL